MGAGSGSPIVYAPSRRVSIDAEWRDVISHLGAANGQHHALHSMAQTTNTAAAKVRAGQSAMIVTLPGGPDRHAGRVSHPRRDRAPHPDVGDTRRIEDDRRRARRRPNGAAISPDGRRYVCNNGGFTSVDDETALLPIARAHDYSGGRMERVDLATGAVDMLYASSDKCSLKGPNDLVFVEMVGSALPPWAQFPRLGDRADP